MIRNTIVSLLLLISFSSLASASIVDANAVKNRLDLGAGTAGFWSGYNIEYGLADNVSIGVDYTTIDLTLAGFWVMKFLGDETKHWGELYDFHVNYQLVEHDIVNPLNISLLLGVGKSVIKRDSKIDEQHELVVGGLCLSFPIFFESLVGRINIVSGPSAGAEIAWKINNFFEINVGATGTGVVGAKLSF